MVPDPDYVIVKKEEKRYSLQPQISASNAELNNICAQPASLHPRAYSSVNQIQELFHNCGTTIGKKQL